MRHNRPVPESTMFRMRWANRGGHIHVRVFECVAGSESDTWQAWVLVGVLVLDGTTWPVFRRMAGYWGDVDVIEEE